MDGWTTPCTLMLLYVERWREADGGMEGDGWMDDALDVDDVDGLIKKSRRGG